MGFGIRAPQRGRGGSGEPRRAAPVRPNLKKAVPEGCLRQAPAAQGGAQGAARELLEVWTGRGACAAGPPAVAGASLGIPPERPPLEEFERSEHLKTRGRYLGRSIVSVGEKMAVVPCPSLTLGDLNVPKPLLSIACDGG